jgi:hypothetical protein
MRRLKWKDETRVSRGVAAVLDSLRLDARGDVCLPEINRQEWQQTLYFLNRNQLTLIAGVVTGDPRLRQFAAANSRRLVQLRRVTREVIAELDGAGIETVLLKGFARAGEYVPDPDARMHYDIDLYCPNAPQAAVKALRAAGYEPVPGTESAASGHLAPLARPTSWQWRDDFFDLETPVHVEMHPRLWVPEVEGFAFEGIDEFWGRRERDGDFCTLSRHDTLAFRSMHLLRHLLRGDLRAANVYEIAWFLHDNRNDADFWREWLNLFSHDLRRGQAVCFALAQRWFGCEMHSVAQACTDNLAEAFRDWMVRHAASPVQSFFHPSKQELALHFAFVDSPTTRFRVAMRRLVPLRHTPRMWEGRFAYLRRLTSRAAYHARTLAPALCRLLIMRR